MTENMPEEIVVPEDEVTDDVSLLDPDITDDDEVDEDDIHPANDDEEPVDD